ncbi:sodium/potassium-transporting ATPase subunit beta [Aplysia californica]|uniref:Sodium/potassium-transporting ATPase subunit beta n=1 Tax=Aplysia californica TaxID=6500 RepID=A0ABM0K8F0_APLCA|nr:sodium/potassium-transporting ATPase subunit beta [Aplysia californica]
MEKPTLKQRLDSFAKFLWNGETKQLLGRGGRSWAEIGLFYLVYYACLAGFFAATIAVFYQTIDSHHPKLQGDSSLLKGNPGMGFKPMPDIDTTLVRSTRNPELKKHIKAMTKSITDVLEDYEIDTLDNTDCGGIDETRPNAKTSCRFNYTALTKNCNAGNNFGMDDNQPCVLLKLNKIYGWSPQVWDSSEIDKVPKEIRSSYTPDRIWVYCHGENPADEDNIGHGQIEYYPMQGFPLAFYPYQKQQDYRSPLVFVQFRNVTRNLGLMVECKAFAKNIEVDQTDKQGSVHFELLNDP